MKYNLKKLISQNTENLLSACNSKHEAKQQVIWMLEEIKKEKQVNFLIKEEIDLNNEQINILNEWINLRVVKKKPLQYILGYVPFLNLKIKTVSPILIPRPETEEWVNFVITKLKTANINREIKILDLCTGSGCIGLSFAKNIPNSFVIGTDINPKAIQLAQENQKLNKINNIKFIQSDFYNNLDSKHKFDIIVSNPPYVCEEEWFKLEDTVKLWEDKNALVANNDCLYAYKNIINNAKLFIKKNKKLQESKINSIFLEIGKSQAKDICFLFEKSALKNIAVFSDLSQNDRMISASL
jgi:release factor glutamine methyltransferase